MIMKSGIISVAVKFYCVFLLLIVSSGFLPLTGLAEGFEENPLELNQGYGYTLDILHNDPDTEIIINLTIDQFEVHEYPIGDEIFTTLEIANTGLIMSLGEPSLPLISRTYRISDNRDPVVEVIPVKTRTLYLKNRVLPSQQAELEDIIEINHRDSSLLSSPLHGNSKWQCLH